MGNPNIIPAAVIDEAVALYLKGYGLKKVVRMLDGKLGRETLRQTLISCGIPRHRTGRPRKGETPNA